MSATVAYRERVNVAPADAFAKVGHFDQLSWCPAIKSATATNGEEIGSIRTLTLGDGAVVVENLRAKTANSYTYGFTEPNATPCHAGYSSTIAVEAIPDAPNACFLEWTGTVPAAKEGFTLDQAVGMLKGLYALIGSSFH